MQGLRNIGEGLWCAEQRARAYGVELGERMCLVRLGSGDLFVHGPITLSPMLAREIERLGPVRYLCVPNLRCFEHLGAWSEAYPQAERLAPLGASEQQGTLGPLVELGADASGAWSSELDHEPIGGIPTLNEVAFVHRQSKTLLLADMAVTIPRRASLLVRGYLRLSLGGLPFGPARDLRWLVVDRAATRRSLRRVSAWRFDRIVVRHGDVLESGAQQALRRAYAWLGSDPEWWQ